MPVAAARDSAAAHAVLATELPRAQAEFAGLRWMPGFQPHAVLALGDDGDAGDNDGGVDSGDGGGGNGNGNAVCSL
eukprot:NODE_4963_length_625_cov_361.661404.p5 GENE.NODE_4963_length_625_cov_361.661404~~NODE_4963_length_625_cov_361.661404.p5  ORF type:complete len:76 (-),score=19.63 NODE_4963_length_625_cov_361.661404:45-272(-)